jgi:uncharacterized protein YndB with AHSA1/START domain
MPAPPPGTSVIEHEVRIAAAPETVFAYFTDPVRMVQWMGAEAMLDPRPGGVCRITFRPSAATVAVLSAAFGGDQADLLRRAVPEAGWVVSGEYVEVDPYRRVAFTWGWEEDLFTLPPRSTAVDVTLTPDGDDTIVRLAHGRLSGAAIEFHRGGWEHYLARLVTAASGGDPGPDEWQPTAAVDPR